MAGSEKQHLVFLVSLGCAKNQVDSERFLGGMELNLLPTTDPAEADLLVINTCAFIESAVRESLDYIFEVNSVRKPGAKLLVMGCLPAREPLTLAEELPEADLLVGPEDYPKLPHLIASLLSVKLPSEVLPFESWPRKLGTPPWRAFLKISEGCNRRCAYCLIPGLRGPLVVRPMDELLSEAGTLAENGVLELTLVAQDLTAWQYRGLDLGDLAAGLAEIKELRWLRLMYAYPKNLTEKLIGRIAGIDKVVPYLDLPLQHASPKILRRMGRPGQPPLKLVEKLRKWWPGVALRTTLMVGFPGETEEDFELLADFVREARFENLGVFKFEPEDKVRASSFPNRVPLRSQKKREAEILGLQKAISREINGQRVGREFDVLTEGASPDSPLVMTGRTVFQAPEVDGLTYFDGEQPDSGRIVRATVVKVQAYDLAVSLAEL
ncbi:MAG: 30S ribosomal protein S12 methylthiotransferase RimO [Deltaproteobacteria bacterium]|nr:30S ribosomal protein S12 methylthiotransferase RimO [Deltaproteobacteria bacterium]